MDYSCSPKAQAERQNSPNNHPPSSNSVSTASLTIPSALCLHPSCPLKFPHAPDLFRDTNRPSPGTTFGASNPPLEIWMAKDRLERGQWCDNDFESVIGFWNAHYVPMTAESKAQLLTTIGNGSGTNPSTGHEHGGEDQTGMTIDSILGIRAAVPDEPNMQAMAEGLEERTDIDGNLVFANDASLTGTDIHGEDVWANDASIAGTDISGENTWASDAPIVGTDIELQSQGGVHDRELRRVQ
ncbi:MAG: hypothetical protein Q9166_006354 [cf. Caloplaca sp. 2 TL-2023]